ncbi:MAG TPA: hypothetical protein VL049_29665 [Candidatus Dormibacteraeota bacterium]|nr:hypothetical protein [Candidatus Dormibacteraeota bacterium]
MRSTRLRSLLFSAAVVLAMASPAAADRPTCEDLLSARQLGQSAEEVAAAFRTTSVRVEACARVAEQHARLDANRQHVEAARIQRIAH